MTGESAGPGGRRVNGAPAGDPAAAALPRRDPRGHKGTFGTVAVMGGQAAAPHVMIGGPALAAEAALRAGAGLAVLALPAPILAAGLTIAPSATGLALPVDGRGELRPSEVAATLDGADGGWSCLAVGPGLGAGAAQQQIMVRLVARPGPPLVIDADALNALAAAGHLQQELRADAVLTPHPGEFRRMASALGIDADPVSPDRRPAAAEALARRLGAVVVLKGPGTVVTDGITTTVNGTGNAALATAGTGDVLTGVIASLVAQHHGGGGLGLRDCARLAVQAHGLAADRWAGRHGDAGMLAADLCAELPAALLELRGGPTA